MKRKNILVFPCGSEIGLDVYRCVKYSTYFKLIGGSSVDDHGKFVFKDYIPNIPFVNAPDFLPVIKKIVAGHSIDAIYPATDLAIDVLKKLEPELGCKVVSSASETTDICLSKRKTYSLLKDVVRIPKQYSIESIDSYPIFVKPDIGHSAIGAEKITSQVELENRLVVDDDILLLEYLPGEEYTVDCFTDRKGNLQFVGARVRQRIKSGISVNTSFVETQAEFRKFAEVINEKIRFRGAWFYQVKRDKKGELCLLEVASRFGGSSLLSCALGVNLPLLSLFDAFDYDVEVLPNEYHVELDRAFGNKYKLDINYNTVYVDYDDCLIVEKRYVNVELVQFLYQCLNRGKRIVLLSKHDGDLELELKQFRLEELFDEVIHISRDEQKCDYVIDKDSIFIDDSHAERKSIMMTRHIPVFAPDMINVLLD